MKEFWIRCAYCNRKLIKRKSNGLFHFKFGKPFKTNKDGIKELRESPTPVDIYIHGSIRIKCFHRHCGKFNTLNYFPGTQQISLSSESGEKETIED